MSLTKLSNQTKNEVEYTFPNYKLNNNFPGPNILQPVPTHLLTLTDHNSIPIHIELDNGATVNYITVNEAKARNFKINPNNQTSNLEDGDTILWACGEINVTLYRDNVPLLFQALVCNKLHCSAIGETLFIKQNSIKQDFINTISLLNDRSIVPATAFEATLPVKPKHSDRNGDTVPLISLKYKQLIMPGDTIDIPTKFADQQVIAEGWRHSDWPAPQLTEVINGSISLTNHSSQPVILRDNKVNSVKITTTKSTDWQLPQL